MASRNGPTITGTDGGDFLHRERVASHYQVSALNKYRLKTCLCCHALLFVVMLAKLSFDILDRLDIFILQLEELEVPKPAKWEYIWTISFAYSLFAVSACRKNSVFLMQIYLGGVVSLSLAPVFYAIAFFSPDVYRFVTTGSRQHLLIWQGVPYCMLNMAFLVLALQVHCFSVFFSTRLLNAWRTKKSN